MGKTYFSLSDNLNFNGKAIKIKANSTEISAKEERKGRAYFNADFQSQIYQSILASQPQVVRVKSDSMIRTETDLRFLNSSAQVGRIAIETGENGGYFVKTNVALNKVTTGAVYMGSAQAEEKEWIVVSGLQVEGFKYQFIETALHDIDNLMIEGVDPANITWLVFVHGYVYSSDDHDREHFSKTAENLGIKIQFIENRTGFIHYINTKAQDGSGTLREKTKIKYLSVFAHGQTPIFTGGDETQFSFSHIQLEYQEYGQGIIQGYQIQVQGNELVVEPGMIKYGGFICLMVEEQRIEYGSVDQTQYLKLKIEVDRRSPDYIAYQIQLLLDLKGKKELKYFAKVNQLVRKLVMSNPEEITDEEAK